MPKRWRIATYDTQRIATFGSEVGVSTLVAQLLLRRGIDNPDSARRFLDCKLNGLREPEELPGALEAAKRIAQAIEHKKKFVIYGDYDADGMTATAILYRALRLFDANVRYYVPSRLEEGYGLSSDALKQLASEGAQTVITVDCGIASISEATAAKECGLELIITDHHAFGESLPVADCLVHPRLPGHPSSFPHLCGAGVAFKVAWALCQTICGEKRVPDRMKNFLMQAIGLVAIGTVADVVPLVDENRILVRHGLTSLKQVPVLGIAELARLTEIERKPFYDSEDIGFTLGPRLNAAGRLGQATLGIELLTTDSKERASALAEYIHELNTSRQSLEKKLYRDAKKQATEKFDIENEPALVLADNDWHLGIIGIVAGRLAERYHRPVVLIGMDAVGVKPGTGSARSAGGLNLNEAFAACAEHLEGFGGHAAAAGLRILPEKIDAFRAAFCEYVSENLPNQGIPPEIEIDAETPFTVLTERTVQQIEGLAPFGEGNSKPILCTTGVQVTGEVKRIGNGGNSLSLTLDHHGVRMRAVAFGNGDWAEELSQFSNSNGETIDIAFRPIINHFRGRRNVEMHLTDWNVSAKEG